MRCLRLMLLAFFLIATLLIFSCSSAAAFYFARRGAEPNERIIPSFSDKRSQDRELTFEPKKETEKPFEWTLREMPSGSVRKPKEDYYVQWLRDGTLLMQDDEGNLIRVHTDGVQQSDATPAIFLHNEHGWEIGKKAEIIFNADNTHAAVPFKEKSRFATHDKPVYKTFQLIDSGKKSAFNLSKKANPPCEESVSIIEYNPAPGAVDYVYICKYNIMHADPSKSEEALSVTTGGGEYRRYGVTDWLNEEEIFGRGNSKAVWWSASGKHLAYALFDDTNVTKVHIPWYYKEQQYPIYDNQAYPKAGTTNNPGVFLWIWSRELNTTQLILPPEELFSGHEPNGSYYLFSANWITLPGANKLPKEYLIAAWANRVQNKVAISICQDKLPCYTDIVIDFAMNGMELWAEPSDFKVEYHSKTGFFVILPHPHKNGMSTIGWLTCKSPRFFSSDGFRTGETHNFRIPTASGADNVDPQCITCTVKDCVDSTTKFSHDGSKFVLICRKAFHHPIAYLMKTGNILEVIPVRDDNIAHQSTDELEATSTPQVRVGKVNTSIGIEAEVMMILPKELDVKKKYPVLLYVYPGPGSSQVHAAWARPEPDQDYIYVTIDGRGSGNRGWKLKEPMHKNFGGPEIDDQIEVMKILLKNHAFMDPKRVVVSGWSYGGYAAVQIGARDGGDTFRCSIAGGTVADFRFYDTAYTERYMGLPSENPTGYQFASLYNETRLAAFKKVHLFLAHGEADDNVHYENSALLSGMLQDMAIHFEQHVYPNEKHGIGGGKYWHLQAEEQRFLKENCFNDV